MDIHWQCTCCVSNHFCLRCSRDMQCVLQQHASFAYALLAAAADRNFARASLIANGFSIMLFLSAGYLIVNLPAYIGWTKWMSPYFVSTRLRSSDPSLTLLVSQYGFRWTAITQFRGRYFECMGVEGVERYGTPGVIGNQPTDVLIVAINVSGTMSSWACASTCTRPSGSTPLASSPSS